MTHRLALRGGLLLATGALAAICVLAPTTIAQDRRSSLPHDPVLSRERAEAIQRAWNERLTYVPGEVLVKFRAGVEHEGRVRALASARAGVDQRNARWVGETLWIRAAGEPDAGRLVATLARQPEIEWAQPNYIRRTTSRPNDPSYTRQWNLDLIDMPLAWDINDGAAQDIVVAVIDSGVTTVSQSFAFRTWTGEGFETVVVPFRVNPDISPARMLPGRDFAFWDGPVLDMDGHGTHVAGTVLQETNNNLALAGIAHRARLMPLKACLGYWDIQFIVSAFDIPGFVDPEAGGVCDTLSGVQALRYAADNGAHIANLSFGGPGESPAYLDALRYAVGRGVFITTSMGNDFDEGNPVEYPARYAPQLPGLMSVGAVGRSSRRASYSGTGSHIEIVAPGGDPADGGATGFVYQYTLIPSDSDPERIIRPRFDRYGEVGYAGTSMAAPHVAGLAALLRSQGITSPSAVEAAIVRFARDLGGAGRDDDFGHGLIDARATLRGLGAAR